MSPQRPMTDREIECIKLLHGNSLSKIFFDSFSHPRIKMRKDLVVDFTMACLAVTKSFDNHDVVNAAVRKLHEPSKKFDGAKPYFYGSLSNLNFAYATEDIKNGLSEKTGQNIILPEAYERSVNNRLWEIRNYLNSEQLRSIFFSEHKRN